MESEKEGGDMKKEIDKDELIAKLVEALHQAEQDCIHYRRKYDALWHVAISEYEADHAILLWETTQRYIKQ